MFIQININFFRATIHIEIPRIKIKDNNKIGASAQIIFKLLEETPGMLD